MLPWGARVTANADVPPSKAKAKQSKYGEYGRESSGAAEFSFLAQEEVPTMLQMLHGSVDNAHVRTSERAQVMQRCAAWAWPLSFGAELSPAYTPQRQEPVTPVTPRFTQQSCARESFSKNLGKDFLVAA